METFNVEDSVVPVIEIPVTDETIAEWAEWEAGAYDRKVAEVDRNRQAAYQAESDPLNFKWQETQDPADRQAWLDKKDEIKARYPDPVKD